MGERRLATRMAVKPVAAASQATRNTTLKAADDAMRAQTPGGGVLGALGRAWPSHGLGSTGQGTARCMRGPV